MIVRYCINAGPACSPQLRQELSRVSLQNLYTAYEQDGLTSAAIFWEVVSGIFEILHSQVSHVHL